MSHSKEHIIGSDYDDNISSEVQPKKKKIKKKSKSPFEYNYDPRRNKINEARRLTSIDKELIS
jgi:hypothetical protein